MNTTARGRELLTKDQRASFMKFPDSDEVIGSYYTFSNEDINEDLIANMSPLGWEHINMLGEYSFKFDDNEEKEILRPLNI